MYKELTKERDSELQFLRILSIRIRGDNCEILEEFRNHNFCDYLVHLLELQNLSLDEMDYCYNYSLDMMKIFAKFQLERTKLRKKRSSLEKLFVCDNRWIRSKALEIFNSLE